VSLPARIVTLLVAFAAVVAGAVFIVLHYLGSSLTVVKLLAGGVRRGRERGHAGGPAERFRQRARLGQLLRAGPEDQGLGAHHLVPGTKKIPG